jgi:N-acetylmuramic acid 6-phosphate etherase
MSNLSLTEKINSDTRNIDLMDALDIAKSINNEDKKVALAVEQTLPQVAKTIDCVAKAFAKGGRLGYFGAGTSGRLGILDASECPPTFGVSDAMVQGFIAGGERAVRFAVENAEDSAELALKDIENFNPTAKDVVIAISASGNPSYVVTVLQKAQELGAATVSITSNPEAKMNAFADIVINPVVGAEAVAGSSRMKAGTAQKLILNMITTGAMIRIGKTYQNLMIDLNITNQKLYDRACRIISEICNLSPQEAQEYLEKSNRQVKTACVMALKKCSREQATELLAQQHGFLRKVI